ncbi:meiotically up-regulated gene 161 protein [Coccidioides immitis RMSCC 2394]|uniref:Meiotically up-regulated gene 161 protein n=1 Tax=Coccidioides immitis RMSCC 2394 TaxID=404692 RepID=A0A0J7AUS1_COCIT|nr:meiotically up-regulated gene 161 protein [Coccidioides immitis RMSCC 2394]
MASKIIVIGGIHSAFKEVFGKLQKLQAKQNFSFALVIGDLFKGDSDTSDEELSALLRGQIAVPLPTYFTVGSHRIPQAVIEKLEKDDEVCPNLYFLGRRGVLTSSEGVKIVALGGNWESAATPVAGVNEKYLPQYTDFDCKSLYKTEHADILITNQWPKSVQSGSKVLVYETRPVEGVKCLADLCSILKPRYHFTSHESFFYEREPFFHVPAEDDSGLKYVTRFLNLAPFNTSKQKWMYAFNLDPNAPPSTSLPAAATITPFLNAPKKREPIQEQGEVFSRFSQSDDYHRPRKRAKRSAPDQSECFFCLSNPNIATHLITSIGTDSYLTIAKGPLTTAGTFPKLGFPGHILIIPLTHAATFSAMGDPDTTKTTYDEMQRYRSALHSMLEERSNGELGSVTWEVSRSGGVHIHWQFLPVPSSLIFRDLLEAAFKVEAEDLHYPKFEKQTVETAPSSQGDHFRVWIRGPGRGSERESGSSLETVLTMPLSGKFRFDLQFGRIVMAKLLRLEDRINWRDATQPQDEETADAEAFKSAFKSFDFSLEE